jgi:hypothetical protein
VTGANLSFTSDLPQDMRDVIAALSEDVWDRQDKNA